MYKITFLDYNYDGGNDAFLPARYRYFDSFVSLIQFCKKYPLYKISDENIVQCGKRFLRNARYF